MNSKFESTREQNIACSASQAVIKGIASDGGLFVRRDMENLKINISELKGKKYTEIAEIILSKILDDYSEKSIKYCVESAYDKKFSSNDITPLVKVGNDYILELFHGPTSAFKDVALSVLPYLSTEALKLNKIKEKILILTATSGDTGKAALEGFKNIEGIKILVFFPNDGVSKVQEKQMISQDGNNTYVYAINGNFDDAQSEVKKIFTDEEVKKKLKNKNYSLSSANSINIGRLVPQIVYYFYSYMKLAESNEISLGEKVNFTVPTGNFGDILAGYYAELMGLPVNKLICASNENNVLYDFIQTGTYDRNRPFYKTLSPSMDILISSNLERLIYHLSGNDNKYIKSLMDELKSDGKYTVTQEIKSCIDNLFYAGYTNDLQTSETIKNVYNEYNYLLDTHTAVAYNVMKEFKEKDSNHKNIVLATASPYKFSKAVYESLFGENNSDEFKIMELLSEKTGVPIPENLKNLKNKKDIHTSIINKEDMKNCFEVIL
ncbi:threonine synthase [uncultured Fusobacterium sp.]|uniref:threonine synthase n=1 Tax=uncultured Fusobacterium sp. TaxID=159267 RepID=UPI0027DAE72B|nr:threonine synthase [uncultured Fusobacterium sp.]